MSLAVETPTDGTVLAVLQGFFEPAAATRMKPMKAELTEWMARIALTPNEAADRIWHESVAGGVYLACVVDSVASRFRMTVSAHVRALVAVISESPGDVTMYLAYGVWAAREEGRDRLDLDGFTGTFHSGFWSREDRDRLWQGQKIDGGGLSGVNGLDCGAVRAWLDSYKPAGTRIADRSPAEHVAWCKGRALALLAAGDVMGAFSAMAAGLRRHKATHDHPGLTLGMGGLIAGHLKAPDRMRHWIEGFH